MTILDAINRHPEHLYAILQIADSLTKYPGRDRLLIEDITPIRPNHSDRVIEPYPLANGGMSKRIEYTHTARSMYSQRWGCVHGITTEGKAHLWMD